MQWIFGVAFLLMLPLAAAGYSSYRRDLAAARARARSRSRVLTGRNGPIEYATCGEGSPVLVLHGASGGWDQGLASAGGLVPYGFQLIVPSRFGYLQTALRTDSSASAEADAWIELLDALQVHRVAVIGFSAGAAPAVQLALRHPQRVSHLVLMVPAAGGLFSPQSGAVPRLALDLLYRSDFAIWLLMRNAPRFMYRLVGVPPSLVPSLAIEDKAHLDEIVDGILPAAPRRLGLLNESNTQNTGREYALERITAPTLLVSAADDLYQTLAVVRHAASVIPHSKVVEFATGGHLLLGRDEEVVREVTRFLKDAGEAAVTAA